MRRLKDRVRRIAFGDSDAREEGYKRTMRGLREGDRQELYLGLALGFLAYLQRTKPKKELLFSKKVAEGTAIVIHAKDSGDPSLEIINPKS